jgi:hypothetical protein
MAGTSVRENDPSSPVTVVSSVTREPLPREILTGRGFFFNLM